MSADTMPTSSSSIASCSHLTGTTPMEESRSISVTNGSMFQIEPEAMDDVHEDTSRVNSTPLCNLRTTSRELTRVRRRSLGGGEDGCTDNKSNNRFSSFHIRRSRLGRAPSSCLRMRSPGYEDSDVVIEKGSGSGCCSFCSPRLPNVAIQESFSTYCQETSLHGWKYVAGSDHSCSLERVAWLTLLVMALIAALIFVYRASIDFASHTVTTNMDSLSTSFDKLYFPAITICNMNFMQRSVLEKYNIYDDAAIDVFDRMMNTGSAENFTQREIEMFAELESRINGTANFKMRSHPQCHHMFLQYFWKNKEVPFRDGYVTMHYRQTTDESVCCQIFPGMLPWENNNKFDINNYSFWLNEPNPWQIIFDGYKPGIKPGKQGVQVLIDVETYEYFAVHSAGSEGVLVLIQHYRDVPLMRKESFILAPGFEVDVGLGITDITTTSGAISRFTPDQRDCYTADEVNLVSLPLKKGYRMSMKNCLYDKALHATKEECGCLPAFYKLGALGTLPTCRGPQLNCAFNIFDDVHQSRPVGTAKVCQAPCNDQIYDTRITMAAYPNRATLPKRDELCLVIEKLLKICHEWIDVNAARFSLEGDELKMKKSILLRKYPDMCDSLSFLNDSSTFVNSTVKCSAVKWQLQTHPNSSMAKDALYSYAKDNLLWLNVYVKDSFATHIVRDERMTRTSFVANVGGLLGLCMGFSLVSVVEIMYFCLKQGARPRRS